MHKAALSPSPTLACRMALLPALLYYSIVNILKTRAWGKMRSLDYPGPPTKKHLGVVLVKFFGMFS